MYKKQGLRQYLVLEAVMFKQALVLLLGLLLFCVGVYGTNVSSSTNLSSDSYLRIHIRANSNLAEDQSVKYRVKDAVVSFLSPKLANLTTKEQAMNLVEQNKASISHVANKVLLDSGFSYGANTILTRETFPTRSYEDVVLPSGEYDSVIVSLGTGTGDNWWCVVYPQLCFQSSLGGDEVVYKSRLFEIIKSIWGGKNE